MSTRGLLFQRDSTTQFQLSPKLTSSSSDRKVSFSRQSIDTFSHFGVTQESLSVGCGEIVDI